MGTKTAKGNVVVVKFFAKYCEPCKRTLPAVQHLTKRLDGVTWIGVSEDEYASDAQALVDAYGLTDIYASRGNALTKSDGTFELLDLVEGAYQVRAREEKEAEEVRRGARALENAGVFAIVLTIIAARNMPGFLEIAVLQRLPLEQGVRYATRTLVLEMNRDRAVSRIRRRAASRHN